MDNNKTKAQRQVLSERTQRWQRENPLQYAIGQKAKNANRRAKAFGIQEKITTKDVFAVFDNARWKCRYCRKRYDYTELSLDHIVPLGAGGANDPSNLESLCKRHHREKDAYDLRLIRHLAKLGVSLSPSERVIGSVDRNLSVVNV